MAQGIRVEFADIFIPARSMGYVIGRSVLTHISIKWLSPAYKFIEALAQRFILA